MTGGVRSDIQTAALLPVCHQRVTVRAYAQQRRPRSAPEQRERGSGSATSSPPM